MVYTEKVRTILMLRPFDTFQIHTFLNHLPERTKLQIRERLVLGIEFLTSFLEVV